MTVPRRNVPSDGPIWLQVEILNFLQLLAGDVVPRPFGQIPAQIQKPWPAFRDAAMVPLGYSPWVLCEAAWILSTTA